MSFPSTAETAAEFNQVGAKKLAVRYLVSGVGVETGNFHMQGIVEKLEAEVGLGRVLLPL